MTDKGRLTTLRQRKCSEVSSQPLTHNSGLTSRRSSLLTTNVVVFETYVLILHRSRNGRLNALKFLEVIEQNVLRVVRVTTADERAAFALVRAHADKTYSLSDAASFTVMNRLGVVQAIALDDDFRSHGQFDILP